MNSKAVINGLMWKFGERIIAQGVAFFISLVLARLMLPEDYGTVTLVLVFINLVNVFVTFGLGDALIQKKDSDEDDFSTIFTCSCIFAVALYAVLFFGAEFIAGFYDNKELVPVIRVLSLQVPLSAIKTIQHAYVSKNMLFKKFFFSTLGGTVISGTVGIIMAYSGFRVWALVAQYLINSIIDIVVLFITVPWRPHLFFQYDRAKVLVSYGWKVTVSQFVNTLYGELRSLIIGKIYTTADLAYYNKGNQFPSLLITNINTSISSVLFPALSNVNDDKKKLKLLTRRSMTISSYVLFPLMTGLMAVAKPLVNILLTERWGPCVPYLQICCIYWMCQPCQTANVQAIMASGRSDICLKLEFIKKGIGLVLILFSMRVSVMAIVITNAIFALVSMLINIVPNKTLIDYGYRDQFADLSVPFILSVIMSVPVYLITFLPISDSLMLICQFLIGICVYTGLSVVTQNESFNYIYSMIRKNLGGKN